MTFHIPWRWRFAAALGAALVVGRSAAATTFYVAPNGSDTLGCPLLTPCQSIQYALSHARTAGDVVELAPGTYGQQVAIAVAGSATQPIVLRGAGATTIIDASGLDYGISISASHVAVQDLVVNGASIHNLHVGSDDIWLSGLTVRGGNAGIVLQDAASATIDHLLVYGLARPLQLRGTTNTVRINFVTVVDASGDPALRVDANATTVSVQNSIFAFNPAGDLAAGFAGVHRYNLRHGNGGSNALLGPDEISGDPLFADLGQGDFHVQSSAGRWDPSSASWLVDALDSPAIDAADPAQPFDRETAPAGSAAELGAYGNTVEASRTQLARIDVYDDPSCQPANAFFPDQPTGPVPLYGFYLESTPSVSANLLTIVLPIALVNLTAGEITPYLETGVSTIGPAAVTASELRFALPQPHAAGDRQTYLLFASFGAVEPGDRLTIDGVQLILDRSGPNVQYHTTPVSHEYPPGTVPQRVTCFSAAGMTPASWWEQPDPASALDYEDPAGGSLADNDPLTGGRAYGLALADGGASSLFLRLDFGSGLAQSARIKLNLDLNQIESVADQLCNNATPNPVDAVQSIYLYNYQGSTGSVDVGSRQVLSSLAGDFSVLALPGIQLASNRICAARQLTLDLSALRQRAPASGNWSVRLIIDIAAGLDVASQPPTKGLVNHVAELSYSAITPPSCNPHDAGWFDARQPDTARPDAARPDAALVDALVRPDSALPDRVGQDLLGVDLALPDTRLPEDAADQPLIARAGPDQRVDVPASVLLDGTASRAPSGAVFTWTQKLTPAGAADSVVGSAAQTTVDLDQPGLWAYELRIEAAGLISTDLVQIEARTPATAGGCDCRQHPISSDLAVLAAIAALLCWRRRFVF